MTSARGAVAEHLAAFNAHDSARLLAGFAGDAVWITGQDRFTGPGELAELFDAGLWGLAPRLHLLGLVAEASRAAAQLHETLIVDGTPREFDIAVFFELADGLIRRAKVYREGSADL
jgi:ketosteroid isomerase-like protein